ncbi:MAG TPA: SRPBCC family protein [Devosia sp.]
MAMPLTIALQGDTEIVVTREFDAPRELVWDCWTVPALIRRWLAGPPGWEMTTCEFDARVGGKWRFVAKGPGGMEMGHGGVIKVFDRPERMVSTEIYDWDWTGGETINTNEFAELAGGRSRSTLTITYSSKEARDGARATPMAEGMEMGFQKLDALLKERAAER